MSHSNGPEGRSDSTDISDSALCTPGDLVSMGLGCGVLVRFRMRI